MTKTLQELHMMSAKLSCLLGGLQDIYVGETDTSQNAILPMMENCHRLSQELDLAIDHVGRSDFKGTKSKSTDAREQKETSPSKRDFDEINRLEGGLGDVQNLAESLEIVSWQLCQETFEHSKAGD